jgi:S-formylglutathione hydrolase FrmB
MNIHRTGRWQELALESDALRGNPLGDPTTRPVYVWTPPSYDDSGDRRYPAVYVLQGMTGQARAWFNVAPFTKNFPDLVEELGAEVIVVLVDGFAAVGGAQWIDSPAIGNYGTYFCEEVVALADAEFRTVRDASGRGVAGKSSGGFGAMVWAMLRPDLFGGFATHAGDTLFEASLLREFAPAAQALRNLYDGSYERFWESFHSGRAVLRDENDPLLLNVYACASAYSSNPDGSVDLPFRIETGELIPEVWKRWLAWDPVRMAAAHAEALRGMRAIWIDAGRNDEYHLDLGSIAFREAIAAVGVPDDVVHFELFDGNHRTTAWRYPLALAFLAERLAA